MFFSQSRRFKAAYIKFEKKYHLKYKQKGARAVTSYQRHDGKVLYTASETFAQLGPSF